ncbi:two-component sensor histidine kinase [Tersicoccus phoenicis]|uniref:Sensor histidine kinase MtrB n=1 Tax=Tersicoccus phoenicis TaxID=554083 RepID=A0A1R1LHQ9_9MICC|nr:MtrAB system histidine kinase MtrB [Tersicoccus phoenicis]OMH27039.1 two-component sensor histidine kinase [Tersicoccus phoenicis]
MTSTGPTSRAALPAGSGDRATRRTGSHRVLTPHRRRRTGVERLWWSIRSGGLALVSRWRHSLQFRTVLLTMGMTLIAFVMVGAFLSHEISSALFSERLRQAEQESRRGFDEVQAIFDRAETNDRATGQQTIYNTLKVLEGDSGSTRRMFLLLQKPGEQGQRWVETARSDNSQLTSAVIPEELRTAVRRDNGQYYQSISLPVGTSDVPAIAVGRIVRVPPGTNYELYLIYTLGDAQDTLSYIHGALWVGGVVLLLAVGAIAWFVTRAVVAPVSDAADVAEKLAAGQLEERINVEGEDELARLGASFNHMAGNLQEQITALAELSRMQQRFVSDVSHELRTPLTTVRMASQVLFDAREDFDPINKRSAELLYHQVERFQTLLADLLEMSRFDAGVAVLDIGDADINNVVRSVQDGTAMLAENVGSTIEVRLDDPSCVVEMDGKRIERVVRNLLVNAIEHGEGRPIQVHVAATDNAVAVTVRDHGIGMTPEDVARVFDRFWRADPARARTTGGSGLGLSIAAEDVNLHHGRLQAWGLAGHGSNFRMILPRRRGEDLVDEPLPLEPVDAPVPAVETGASAVILDPADRGPAVVGREDTGTVTGTAATAEPSSSGRGGA